MQVIVRDNNVDQALKALKKKMQREGIFREMKLRNHYEKPSEKKAREKAEGVRRARKLARKRAQREGLIPSKPKPVMGAARRPCGRSGRSWRRASRRVRRWRRWRRRRVQPRPALSGSYRFWVRRGALSAPFPFLTLVFVTNDAGYRRA